MSSSEPEQKKVDTDSSNRMNRQSLKLKICKEQELQTHQYHSPFLKLKRNATNLFNQDLYSDDNFKLQPLNLTSKANRKISIRRLKDIFPPGTPLFCEKIDRNFNKHAGLSISHFPAWICQMYMLPFRHYETLIEPKYVNQKGYYHVVIYKEGRLIKEIIDDTFYYDQVFETIHTLLLGFDFDIWMHILFKIWAKSKGGYDGLLSTNPLDFIKTFTYPDWIIINPFLENIQNLVQKINPIQKGEIFVVAQTKNDSNVGLFGLIPNSAGYLVTGLQMQFEAVYIKLQSFNGSKWNGVKSIEDMQGPEDQFELKQNEFLMPIKQFTNLFHLLHLTTNKFDCKQDIFYTRYSLNLDARQSKAKMILVQVNAPLSASQTITDKYPKDFYHMVNLTFYFPSVRAYDLIRENNLHQNDQSFKIPFSKLMFGKQQQTTNLETSFVESMKQIMLNNEKEDFASDKSSVQYEWIQGTYFKGYDHTCTFLMRLRPGRYFLRFKIETLRIEYRTNINIVSSTHVKISDPKMDKRQQQQFLKEMLSSKARLQKRNIGYLNPTKKGSWYICNKDFNSIGYGYIVIQTIQKSEYSIELRVDRKALRGCGYKLKQQKDQNKQTITLKQGEGYVLILKIQDEFQNRNPRKWPPEGIQIARVVKE